MEVRKCSTPGKVVVETLRFDSVIRLLSVRTLEQLDTCITTFKTLYNNTPAVCCFPSIVYNIFKINSPPNPVL